VDDGTRAGPPQYRQGHDTDDKGATIMPRLNLGAVGATWRSALRRLDHWTLQTLNPPAGGRLPRL
jgi:hypothetical protein